MLATIGVIDDHRDCAAVIIEMIARMGYGTVELPPGPAPIDRLAALHRRRQIDLVITGSVHVRTGWI